ncbi:DoxX family protein [uncultured Martelella sp.]|uniref:DoxX family protein n=1 Tax=uncultured Martelella sp. TaxID=392331 RepID=UPI0029C8C5EB|nr:DoxX family protein [uncultured Martelella sp.]
MSDITFKNEPARLYFPFLAGFYDRVAQPLAWVAFRVAIGGLLAIEGWPKITHPMGQVGFVENLHFYPGWLWSPTLAAIQFFGGILIVLGLFTRAAALANAVMLSITIVFHYTHPYGHAFLTPAGIEALTTHAEFFTSAAQRRLADGGHAFLELAQGKAEQDSWFWAGGAFLFAAFGGRYFALDNMMKKIF